MVPCAEALGLAFDGVTYVPLSRGGRKKRGYDQSRLLAKAVAKSLGLPLLDVLEKARETKIQHQLGREERAQNVRGRLPGHRACGRADPAVDRRHCDHRRHLDRVRRGTVPGRGQGGGLSVRRRRPRTGTGEEEARVIHRFSREELLIGKAGLKKLRQARVAVFGIGGVGSYVVEALARSGVGALDLFDSDTRGPLQHQPAAHRVGVHPGPPQGGGGQGAGAADQPRLPGGGPAAVLHPGERRGGGLLSVRLRGRRHRHGDGEAGAHPPLPGGRGAGDLLHGHGEQAGPHRLPGDCP